MNPNRHPIVVAITGASGVIYGRRLLEVLGQTDHEIHLTISESGRLVLQHELQIKIDLENFRCPFGSNRVFYHGRPAGNAV